MRVRLAERIGKTGAGNRCRIICERSTDSPARLGVRIFPMQLAYSVTVIDAGRRHAAEAAADRRVTLIVQ